MYIFSKSVFIISLLYTGLNSFSQDKTEQAKKKNADEIIGYSLFAGYAQGHYGFAEIGLARFSEDRSARHYNISCKSISIEFSPIHKPVVAPKLSFWGGGMVPMVISLNLLCYTDFSSACVVFRPEYGFGGEKFKLVWGYNARVINTKFDRLSRHLVSGQVYFGLKKKQFQ